jgi:hypothetical protein
MRGKAALVVGLATGYVLGTRDGRARYQQIKTQANRIMQDPRVQQKAAQATDLAKQKAPLVKDKVADVTHKASSKVSSKAGGQAGDKRGTTSPSGSDLPAQTTVSAPDLTHSTTDSSPSVEDSADEDAILITPPSPSPLAPGPTQTSSSTPSSGGPNG